MSITIETTKENDFVKTGDLSLAGFLFLHYPLEVVERQPNSKKAYFVFRRDEHIDELIACFWRGQAKSEPQAYFNALRSIKARLYGEE